MSDDPCQDGSVQDGSLLVLEVSLLEFSHEFGSQNHRTGGPGPPGGHGLGANIDHAGLAHLIKMGEFTHRRNARTSTEKSERFCCRNQSQERKGARLPCGNTL